MKQLIKCTKTQIYLAVRLPYFWISMFFMALYLIANTIHYGVSYYGYSATGITTASDLYILNDINPYWGIFSMIIPFICMFPFSMQPINDRQCGTEVYLVNRTSRKLYYISGVLCSAVSTFFIICINVFVSIIGLYIMFGENGNAYEGAKYSDSYWFNIESGYCYHFQELHTYHPVIYLILITLIFAAFCSVVAVFMYAIATLIKRDKLCIMLVAGVVSFVINQIYLMADYSIYGDVTASTVGQQSGMPTILLGVIMLLTSVIIIACQIKSNDV